MGAEGSGLDVLLAVPWLARWSFGYQRVNFESGSVRLLDSRGVIEDQRFWFEASAVRVKYHAFNLNDMALSVWGSWHRRGLPRQIYLAESSPDEEGETLYYDISDQLLWVESSAIDFGVEVSGLSDQRAGWMWRLGFGLGGGSYELRAPLSGAGLDRGSLLTLPLYGELGYRIPLSESTGVKLNYRVDLLMLQPLGLPDELDAELSAEEDTSDLSLSFGSIDVSQRFWLSLYVEL